MVKLSGGFSGRVRIVKTREDGTVTYDESFHNHILASGVSSLYQRMHALGTDSADWDYYLDRLVFTSFQYLFLGTGTTEPTIDDSGLEARSGTLAGKLFRDAHAENYGDYMSGSFRNSNPVASFNDPDNGIHWVEMTMDFPYGKGEAEGVWTELGLADSTSYTNPFSRALIRDGSGTPISLTVLSDEYLSVFYTIRFEDGMGFPQDTTFDMDGTTYTCSFGPIHGGWRDNHGYFGENLPLLLMTPTSGDLSWFGSDYSYSKSFDPVTLTATHDWTFPPTNDNRSIGGMTNTTGASLPPSFADGINFLMPYGGYFSPVIQKPANNQVTMSIQCQITILGPPVEGVVFTEGSTTLDATWDAYPNATEYQVVLRQAGAEIINQTITAPTVTASFAGLTPSTQYDLDVQAITPGRNSSRVIFSASTTA